MCLRANLLRGGRLVAIRRWSSGGRVEMVVVCAIVGFLVGGIYVVLVFLER